MENYFSGKHSDSEKISELWRKFKRGRNTLKNWKKTSNIRWKPGEIKMLLKKKKKKKIEILLSTMKPNSFYPMVIGTCIRACFWLLGFWKDNKALIDYSDGLFAPEKIGFCMEKFILSPILTRNILWKVSFYKEKFCEGFCFWDETFYEGSVSEMLNFVKDLLKD